MRQFDGTHTQCIQYMAIVIALHLVGVARGMPNARCPSRTLFTNAPSAYRERMLFCYKFLLYTNNVIMWMARDACTPMLLMCVCVFLWDNDLIRALPLLLICLRTEENTQKEHLSTGRSAVQRTENWYFSGESRKLRTFICLIIKLYHECDRRGPCFHCFRTDGWVISMTLFPASFSMHKCSGKTVRYSPVRILVRASIEKFRRWIRQSIATNAILLCAWSWIKIKIQLATIIAIEFSESTLRKI